MLKLFLLGLTLIVAISAVIFFFPSLTHQSETKVIDPLTLIHNSSTQTAQGLHEVPATVDDHTRIGVLEESLASLQNQVNQYLGTASSSGTAITPITTPVTNTNLTSSVQNLTTNVNNLITRVAQIDSSGTSSKPSTTYIPLGPANSSNSLDWQTVSLPEVDIDPAEYPGYKAMYLETYMSVYQGNGQAFAHLLNYSDGITVLNSDVSTSSENYIHVISNAFTLGSGKKTYRLQLKTLTGYTAQVEYARIKVTF